MAQGPSDTI